MQREHGSCQFVAITREGYATAREGHDPQLPGLGLMEREHWVSPHASFKIPPFVSCFIPCYNCNPHILQAVNEPGLLALQPHAEASCLLRLFLLHHQRLNNEKLQMTTTCYLTPLESI